VNCGSDLRLALSDSEGASPPRFALVEGLQPRSECRVYSFATYRAGLHIWQRKIAPMILPSQRRAVRMLAGRYRGRHSDGYIAIGMDHFACQATAPGQRRQGQRNVCTGISRVTPRR